MKLTQYVFRIFALSPFFTCALAQAMQVSGTVTDKTTGKPAAGDSVVLVDVEAGMGEEARATTNARGNYTLSEPGSGPYLIRVMHQGVGYFIAAPQGGGPGDIPVFDVAAKVQGVHLEADVIEMESDNGLLTVDERYLVHNTSSPPVTQWSQRSFEIVLPAEAVVIETGAQRPDGLPTSVKLNPEGTKGHYSFDFPIQPDDGDKETVFQVNYTLPYKSGKFAFKAQETLPADAVAVLLPKNMSLTSGAGSSFNSISPGPGMDPGVQTLLAKNAMPGKAVEFIISGTGSLPREDQNAPPGSQGDNGQAASAPASRPGGGIGEPINAPDPLSRYKWWILGGLALLLSAAAAFLLRKPEGAPVASSLPVCGSVPAPAFSSPQAKNTALLNALKEELFALESEKIAGTLTAEDYAEAKAALETVLKRALKRS
jgi:hypothetical protein